MRGQERAGLDRAMTRVAAVDEAGEREEPVDGVPVRSDLGFVRAPEPPVDGLDVLAQLRPGREAVAAGDRELRAGQAYTGRALRSRVMLGQERQCIRVTGPTAALEAPALVVQVLEARPAGQLAGRHRTPFPSR
jgi:hypothetical protein